MPSITATLLLLCFFSAAATAQDTCVYLYAIPQKANFATADHLSNSYLLHGFEVGKYDSTGRIVSGYSNNRLGMPAFLDASNPLKILVWYADFQTGVFLDRNMTELGRLNLSEAGLPAVRQVAAAFDGNIWAYNEASAQLIKISTSGEILIESQPLNLAFPQRFSPTCIRDDGGQAVYLSDPAQGLAVFDPFAQLDKVLPLKGLVQFEVANGILFFVENGDIRIEDWRGLFAKRFSLRLEAPSVEATVWMSKKRVFVQSGSGLKVYRF